MWVPVQFSGINQGSQRNSLVLLISWFYYFPDSQPVSPYPHLSLFCSDLQRSQGGAFSLSACLTPFLSPLSTTAECFSCRTGAFIKLHTQKQLNGLFKPVILSRVLLFCERIKRILKLENKGESAPLAFL